MFDKLVESNSAEADFKPRRKFFMVSTVVVGILFLTAVMISLYAQNIDIGAAQFEISELLAPVTPDAPEPPQPQPPQNQEDQSDLPSRQSIMASVDQPTVVPIAISTERNTRLPTPYGKFLLNPNAPESTSIGIPGDGVATRTSTGTSSATSVSEPDEDVKPTEPPPVVKPKPPPTQSLGVINGKATYLPHPPYPEVAKRVNAQGSVDVQVTIDETGKVISSRAVSGHPFLRSPAEKAALNARFTPTLLSKVPVKVTGVIVYKFTRN